MQRLENPSVSALIVSIHDVCPGSQDQVEEMLGDLAAAGVPATSLLVIPNRHKKDPSFSHPEFCSWLKEKQAAGHEAVLHGYYHMRIAEGEPTGWKKVMAKQYTAGEGEFFDLDYETARELLLRGHEEMTQSLGREPSGFIAPAWLLGPEALQAVLEMPFSYTTRIGDILRPGPGESSERVDDAISHASQSLCYSVRAPWRRACSLVWNEMLLAWLGYRPLIRIGLHPPDWDFPSIRSHALRCVKRALVGRTPMTYDQWVHHETQSASSP